MRVPGPGPSVGAPFVFADVYSQNVTFVWRTLRALGVSEAAVADAAQDAFVVVHRKLPDFDGRCAIRTWLFHVVYLVACEYRRKALRTAGHEPIADALRDGGPDPAEAFERREASSLLNALLAELDDDRRIVLVLAEIEEMTVPEIAEIVGAPLNTVYTRLRRARLQISKTVRARQRRPS